MGLSDNRCCVPCLTRNPGKPCGSTEKRGFRCPGSPACCRWSTNAAISLGRAPPCGCGCPMCVWRPRRKVSGFDAAAAPSRRPGYVGACCSPPRFAGRTPQRVGAIDCWWRPHRARRDKRAGTAPSMRGPETSKGEVEELGIANPGPAATGGSVSSTSHGQRSLERVAVLRPLVSN